MRSSIKLIESLHSQKKYVLVLIEDFPLPAQDAEVKVQRRQFFALETESVNHFRFSVELDLTRLRLPLKVYVKFLFSSLKKVVHIFLSSFTDSFHDKGLRVVVLHDLHFEVVVGTIEVML